MKNSEIVTVYVPVEGKSRSEMDEKCYNKPVYVECNTCCIFRFSSHRYLCTLCLVGGLWANDVRSSFIWFSHFLHRLSRWNGVARHKFGLQARWQYDTAIRLPILSLFPDVRLLPAKEIRKLIGGGRRFQGDSAAVGSPSFALPLFTSFSFCPVMAWQNHRSDA